MTKQTLFRYAGRQMTKQEVQQFGLEIAPLKKRPAFYQKQQQIYCARCQTIVDKRVCLPDGRYYCQACLGFGRLCQGDQLYYLPGCPLPKEVAALTWQGQLTTLQAQVSQAVIKTVLNQDKLIITAVTGAGKTEMLFLGIETALSKGMKVGLVSPRVDVCLELYPRVQAAFNNTAILLLYGESQAPFENTPLVICTTHQLLKFFDCFDVLILDEADAFPFTKQPMLQSGLNQACKKRHSLILLTATPTNNHRKMINNRQMHHQTMPLRFHGYLLPEPLLVWQPHWQQKVVKKQLSSQAIATIKKLLEQQQLLCFVPKIEVLEPVLELLQTILPDVPIATLHAKDSHRQKKVQAFRQQAIQLLVTTTILERGVTFKNCGVIVLGADQAIFEAQTLIQIAGRAGRNRDFPNNPVIFIYQYYTKAIRKAVRTIKQLNKAGEKLR